MIMCLRLRVCLGLKTQNPKPHTLETVLRVLPVLLDPMAAVANPLARNRVLSTLNPNPKPGSDKKCPSRIDP